MELTIQDYQGRHNSDLAGAANRLKGANSYKDLSTICIIPNQSGEVPARVVQNWLGIANLMNQKFFRHMVSGMDDASVYNGMIEQAVSNPGLATFDYILFMSENAMPPFDAMMKLFEHIENHDVIGGLSYDKGPGGLPKIYGHPSLIPQSFAQINPQENVIQPCNGIGLDFCLMKKSIFKDTRLPKPWFRSTRQLVSNGDRNTKIPDMYFFDNLAKLGYKVACDTRVKVGMYDLATDLVW